MKTGILIKERSIMNICRSCQKGNHYECDGLIFKIEKKSIIFGNRKVEIPNKCECTCNKIIQEDTSQFSEKLGPDIREIKL